MASVEARIAARLAGAALLGLITASAVAQTDATPTVAGAASAAAPAAVAADASAPAQAPAAKAESSKARAADRFSSPMTIEADQTDYAQNKGHVSGNVHMFSEGMDIRGDAMDIQQFPDGSFQAVVTGSPATLDHDGQGLDPKLAPVPVHVEADKLTYNSKTTVVDLQGNGVLKRGTDVMTSAHIEYNLSQQQLQAGGDGRVRLVIQPAKPSEAGLTPEQRAQQNSGEEAPAEAPKP